MINFRISYNKVSVQLLKFIIYCKLGMTDKNSKYDNIAKTLLEPVLIQKD